jgi:hypothetical protein
MIKKSIILIVVVFSLILSSKSAGPSPGISFIEGFSHELDLQNITEGILNCSADSAFLNKTNELAEYLSKKNFISLPKALNDVSKALLSYPGDCKENYDELANFFTAIKNAYKINPKEFRQYVATNIKNHHSDITRAFDDIQRDGLEGDLYSMGESFAQILESMFEELVSNKDLNKFFRESLTEEVKKEISDHDLGEFLKNPSVPKKQAKGKRGFFNCEVMGRKLKTEISSMYKLFRTGDVASARSLGNMVTEDLKIFREKCPETSKETVSFFPFLYEMNSNSDGLKAKLERKNEGIGSVLDSDILLLDEENSKMSWYEGGFDACGVVEAIFNGFLSNIQF